MSGTFTENSLGSFASGKKRYARCVETYVDKYNAVGSGSPRLTKGKIYQVYKEGDYHNPTNAFKTYFKMIFIKDDNHNSWGLVEDLFDMDVEYASEYDVNQLRIKDANQSIVVKEKDDYLVQSKQEGYDSDFEPSNESYGQSGVCSTRSYTPKPLTAEEVRKQNLNRLVIGCIIFVVAVFLFKSGIGILGDFAKYQDSIKKQSETKVFK